MATLHLSKPTRRGFYSLVFVGMSASFLNAGFTSGQADREFRMDYLADDMRQVLEKHAELDPEPIDSLSAEEARRQPTPADAVKRLLADQGREPPEPALASVRDVQVPGQNGPIPARVYTPEGEGPFPVIAYFHGGGFVIAGIDVYEASAQALAEQTGAVVVAVAYRQAPEDVFPAAHEDAYAASQHIIRNARQFGGETGRVAVAGESAGGNLATAVCLMARDRGGELPVHQLLIYPVVDNDTETDSYRANEDAKPLNKAMMNWFFEKYVPSEPDDARLAGYLTPLNADDLSGLPPATVITAEFDPLRSEGRAYAEALREAGVDVLYRNYDDVTHEFFGMASVVAKAREAQGFAAERLRSALAD